MRVDGSLQGVDEKAGTLIPTWKRGHFSLLFDGAQTPAALLLVDHRKRTVVDLTKEKKKYKPDLDDEVPLRPSAAQQCTGQPMTIQPMIHDALLRQSLSPQLLPEPPHHLHQI